MICQKCGGKFPTKVKIGGIKRNLNSRKFCLDCSPFGNHNTRNLLLPRTGDIVECKICNKDFVLDRARGSRQFVCSCCSASRRRVRKKLRCALYLGGSCRKCGYNKCLGALHFHHRFDKSFNLSRKMYTSWKTLKPELDKCVLLCANCHLEHHCLESETLNLSDIETNISKKRDRRRNRTV